MQDNNTILQHTYVRQLRDKSQLCEFLLDCLETLVREENKLTTAEKEVLVYRLLTPAPLNCFNGVQRKFMMSQLGVSSPALTMRVKSLVEKGWLQIRFNGCKTYYDLPVQLSTIKKQLDAGKELIELQVTLIGKIIS